MSVLQAAFKLVSGEFAREEIETYLAYIEPMSHESVPGIHRYMNLRGVSTHVAYVRLLAEMLKMASQPGGTGEYSYRSLADQVGYLATLRTCPIWETEEHYVAEADLRTGKMPNLINLLLRLKASRDYNLTVKMYRDDAPDLLRWSQLLDSEFSTEALATTPVSKFTGYLGLHGHGHLIMNME